MNTGKGTTPLAINTSTMGRFPNRVALLAGNREGVELSRERLKSDLELAMY